MARRRRQADDDVSLFPFLSIIACVIGVLTLMISTLALAQLDTSVVAQAEEFDRTQDELAAAREQLAQLQTELAEKRNAADQNADANTRRTADLRQQISDLQKSIDKEQQALAEQQKVEIVIPTIPESQRESVEDLKLQVIELREQLAQLEKAIEERKLPPDEAEVSILPAGSGLAQKPYFVECAAGAIVIHQGQKPKRIRAGAMATSEEFVGLLEEVASAEKNILLFLVRSDGLSVYRQAKKLADDNGVPNGKLPVVGKGRIDLEYFQRERGAGS